ncbi:MAG: hypothetical protein EHM17_00335 [Verrucomicrobiaceae bacterium]|nr:MAG: hypothetical protein EHM17_17340 [Verrucomicrobiaceae bacterium]RPJ30675.1 MAG: hypothetical protein EHM17_16290 [Verrucomicrobiaceae bacterium]RPJ31509.1 MAG: hypothetical protein EHM17_15375 [Verrucomicrobiaceae bacterium]RPJ33180.1 MAG: hypothetical protein EHM17_11230 [Verrucomicrobiaceae bacterium]RPJ36006.1 MAG: hypothetical protein EHM17_00335 [Verrucomicrobiaceae bacterium]
MTLPTAYDLLAAHYDKHKYKRGAYVGSAPLDAHKRRKTNQRVTVSPLCAEVVCHKTPILRAYPDGRVQLDASSWRTNVTKDTLNSALARIKLPSRIYSHKRFGLSQWHLYSPTHGHYAFYDGMYLNQHGTPRRSLPFKRRCIDTTQSRPFAASAREFRSVFPVLHAGVPDTKDAAAANDTQQLYYQHKLYDSRAVALAITTQPELWPAVVAAYSQLSIHIMWQQRKLPAKDTLNHILTKAKEHMYHTIETLVTHIPA